MTDFHAHCGKALAEIRAQQRYRTFTALEKQADRFPLYRGPGGREVLVWSSNDYLAMGGHPVVVEAACAAARSMGAGAGGTRNISGTSPLHDALEAELASLHGKQSGLLFTSGFVSNQAALSAVLNSEPSGPGQPWRVFSDARNHASMIAGIKGSRGICSIFQHNDMAELEALLRSAPPAAPKLIAFESVYSMDADIAPVGAICDLAARYGAMTYLDEVHAVGMSTSLKARSPRRLAAMAAMSPATATSSTSSAASRPGSSSRLRCRRRPWRLLWRVCGMYARTTRGGENCSSGPMR